MGTRSKHERGGTAKIPRVDRAATEKPNRSPKECGWYSCHYVKNKVGGGRGAGGAGPQLEGHTWSPLTPSGIRVGMTGVPSCQTFSAAPTPEPSSMGSPTSRKVISTPPSAPPASAHPCCPGARCGTPCPCTSASPRPRDRLYLCVERGGGRVVGEEAWVEVGVRQGPGWSGGGRRRGASAKSTNMHGNAAKRQGSLGKGFHPRPY